MKQIQQTPYRTPAEVARQEEVYYGLILAPKPSPPKPHRCNPPGYFKRFILYLTGKRVRPGSVFRCTCKKVHYLNYGEWFNIDKYDNEWLKLGGKIEETITVFEPTIENNVKVIGKGRISQ